MRDLPTRAPSAAARRRAARRGALDTPLEYRPLLPTPRMDPDAFGQFAEAFARFMGTARFLAYMTVFVIIWIAVNIIGLYG